MLEILLYYVWVVVFLYLSYVILFCSYEQRYSTDEEGEKVKYPLFLYILAVIIALLPFVNVIGIVLLCLYMHDMADRGVEFRTFLFKKK
jgi:L-asparagine transporter-like permease